MSLSRPNKKAPTPTNEPYKEVPESQRHYVGRSRAEVEYSTDQPLHWYQAWLLGYRAKKWQNNDKDCDDSRYDLKEKE